MSIAEHDVVIIGGGQGCFASAAKLLRERTIVRVRDLVSDP
jgi:cation diffusion facilitator CzcD-associated flavoprotein CzcO